MDAICHDLKQTKCIKRINKLYKTHVTIDSLALLIKIADCQFLIFSYRYKIRVMVIHINDIYQ